MTEKPIQWLMDACQKALNYYLSLDPDSSRRLAKLQNKIVKIDLLGIDATFFLIFSAQDVRLATATDRKVNTFIKGTPLRLLHMSLSGNDRKQFFADDISIEGNLELGQQVIDLFDQMEIDWEEKLSQFVGDVSAHRVGNVARQIKSWVQQTRDTFVQNTNEYIHEEINLFPPREALRDFFQDVDELRMDVDRIEARISRLK
jgi:ubiquinone biosynthesis protein UbiJ